MNVKKILIIDDEDEMARCLTGFFGERGYSTSVAQDGAQALMQVQKVRPDLVILDIMLPAGGGFHVLGRIRENVKLSGLPVIIITARADDLTREKAEALGVSGYFQKPVDLAKLFEKVSAVLA